MNAMQLETLPALVHSSYPQSRRLSLTKNNDKMNYSGQHHKSQYIYALFIDTYIHTYKQTLLFLDMNNHATPQIQHTQATLTIHIEQHWGDCLLCFVLWNLDGFWVKDILCSSGDIQNLFAQCFLG